MSLAVRQKQEPWKAAGVRLLLLASIRWCLFICTGSDSPCAAAGMLQWGNVFFCVAKRTVDRAAVAGQDISEVSDAAEADLKKAEAKYEESRRIKPDYHDAFISIGNVAFERAKLSLGFAVPPPQCVACSLR